MKHIETTIRGESWNAEHAPEKQEPFVLSLNKSEKVILDGVGLTALNERDALTEKVIKHDLMDDFGHTVDSKSIIPFGVEPMLSRKFDYYLKTIRITTDIRLRGKTTLTEFNVDDMRLTGEWSRFAVITLDAKGDMPNSIPWVDTPSKAGTLWKADKVFSFILLESANGTRLEIGTGFDLWRWNTAPSMGATGRFTLEKKDNGEIILKRTVLHFDAETEIAGREWRFNWYLSWSTGPFENRENRFDDEINAFPPTGGKAKLPRNKQKDLAFSLKETQWPEQARISRNANLATSPCFHSKMVRNHLRKTIRSIAARADESLENVLILDCTPHFCDSCRHLERPKQGNLAHWDIADIITLHFWANRKLHKKNVKLKIRAPFDGIFNELPSFISMG